MAVKISEMILDTSDKSESINFDKGSGKWKITIEELTEPTYILEEITWRV